MRETSSLGALSLLEGLVKKSRSKELDLDFSRFYPIFDAELDLKSCVNLLVLFSSPFLLLESDF